MAAPSGTIATAATAAAKTATAFTAGSAAFSPRQVFDVSPSITRSYFLGHHHAALGRMRQTLSNVGLIIECRDFRVPLTSWNPLLERSLAANPAERARIIVYTKRDLGPSGRDSRANDNRHQSSSEVMRALRDFHDQNRHAAAVMFLGTGRDDGSSLSTDGKLLEAIKRVARESDSLTGLRAMVVGMPNTGKSTLLNRMRARGMGLPKAAKTGAQPGITRKLGTPVRIAPGESTRGFEGLGEGVFVVDTPGVFVPYVSAPEDMLKLALVGCVKDGLVPAVTVADYLLYHLNLVDPALYTDRFCGGAPTNDVHEFLRGIARRTGKLLKGGQPSLEGAAEWVVQEWRRGGLGRFLLDVVTPETLATAVEAAREPTLSMNQARKKEKEARKARSEAKRFGSSAPSSD